MGDGAAVSKLLAEKWKSLPSEQQQEYYQEAERLKNLHMLQHPNYKYTPKSRRLGTKKSVAKLDQKSPSTTGPTFLPIVPAVSNLVPENEELLIPSSNTLPVMDIADESNEQVVQLD